MRKRKSNTLELIDLSFFNDHCDLNDESFFKDGDTNRVMIVKFSPDNTDKLYLE